MKKSLTFLIAAQFITLVTVLITHAELYTLLFIYVIQTFIVLGVNAVRQIKLPGKLSKLLFVGHFLIFVFMYYVLFLALSDMQNSSIIDAEGKTRILHLGQLYLPAIIIGTVVFLIYYMVDSIRYHTDYSPNNPEGTLRAFFIIIANAAALTLIFYTVATIESLTACIVCIAIIKTSLDVGVLILSSDK